MPGPPPQCRLLPLPTPAPSSRPPPPRGPRTGQPQPDSPTLARPPPLTLTRRAPRADTAHGRAPRHASPRSGPGPSPCRGSGRGATGEGRARERGGGGSRASANAPGRGNRASDVSSGVWPPPRHHPKRAGRSGRHSHTDGVWGRVRREKLVLCSQTRLRSDLKAGGVGTEGTGHGRRLTGPVLPVILHGERKPHCVQGSHLFKMRP